MIFIALVRGEVRQERHRPRLLDRVRQLALVPGTAARDAPGNDLASLADEAPETAHVLVVDEIDLVHAELADLPPAEPAALDGLLGCRGNGSLLPLLGARPLGARTGRRRCPSRLLRRTARPPAPSPARRARRVPWTSTARPRTP